MERTPEKSHGGATGFKPPPGVTVNQIPADKSIGSMMLAGELDAALHYLVRPQSGRPQPRRSRQPSRFQISVSRSGRRGHPLLPQDRTLPDQSSGRGPARHLRKGAVGGASTCSRRSSANDIANAQRIAACRSITSPPACCPATPKTPLIHHGVKANRKVIETIAQYSLEQGLTQRLIKIDELYAPNVLES